MQNHGQGSPVRVGFPAAQGRAPVFYPSPAHTGGWAGSTFPPVLLPRTARMNYGPEQILTTCISPLPRDSTSLFYQFCTTSFLNWASDAGPGKRVIKWFNWQNRGRVEHLAEEGGSDSRRNHKIHSVIHRSKESWLKLSKDIERII